jgi:hypothetical protein
MTMNKNIWKIVMFGAGLTLILGFVIAIWSVNEHNVVGIYLGLVTIAGVCVSWWFWVMFIIRTMIKQNDKTCSELGQVKIGISQVKQLIREYVKLNNIGYRQRGKSEDS